MIPDKRCAPGNSLCLRGKYFDSSRIAGADRQPERIGHRGLLHSHLRHGREEQVGSGQLEERVKERGDVAVNPHLGVNQVGAVLAWLLARCGAHHTGP